VQVVRCNNNHVVQKLSKASLLLGSAAGSSLGAGARTGPPERRQRPGQPPVQVRGVSRGRQAACQAHQRPPARRRLSVAGRRPGAQRVGLRQVAQRVALVAAQAGKVQARQGAACRRAPR